MALPSPQDEQDAADDRHETRRYVQGVAILRGHREEQAEVAAFVGDGWRNSGYVFPTVIGTHTRPDNVGKRFTELVRATDVPYLTVHGLRHTYATHLLSMGQNPEWSAATRHADVAFASRSVATSSPATNAKQRRPQRGSVD